MKDLELTDEEKKILLQLARSEISRALTGEEPKVSFPKKGELGACHGAFVSLHKKACLRGCIGVFSASKPLCETVSDMAYSAAFHDPRFLPLTISELPEIDIEISVLSPLWKIDDIDEIQVGKHGIYIVKGFHRGVLLPQVATENKWDRLTFLQHTCHKAGLPGECWKSGADIYLFTAVIFGEAEKKN